LGLAQLHQIRGRVGRSNRYAWAYFTFKQGKVLSENAMKRLNTIREFAAFNSGVKIALRDLEIRGAGNLLGAEQSGHMQSVGYDMYLKLLEEAVVEQKGEKVKRKPTCSADLTVSASIPDSYISSQEQRMDFYRRIAFVETQEDADDMIDELSDRFGEPPEPVLELIRVAILRGEAASAGVTDISQKGGQLVFTLSDIDNTAMFELFAHPEYSKRLRVERSATKPTFALRLFKGSNVIEECRQFVAAVSPVMPIAA
jgi:transcription-repair coupling factor (superfamily II helicase)